MEKSQTSEPVDSSTDSPDGISVTGKNILEAKSFRDGGIYLFKRGDYKRPTWMCRVKAPGMTGYIYRSTRSTDEHQAYRFADDLYRQQLVKAYSGLTEKGTKVSVGIDAYIKRFEPETDQLSVRYRILLLKRVQSHIGKQTFESLTTASISKLTDDLRKATKKGIMSPNTTKRVHNDLRHFLRWSVEEGFLKDCQPASKRDPLSARKRDPLSGLRTVDVTRFLALRAA